MLPLRSRSCRSKSFQVFAQVLLFVGLLLFGTGCGGGSVSTSSKSGAPTGGNPPTGVADFSLSFPAGTAITLTQGASQSVIVEIDPVNSFSGTVSVTVSGLPTGVTAQPLSIPVTGSSATGILQLNAASDTVPGTVNITLQASSGTLQHQATLNPARK